MTMVVCKRKQSGRKRGRGFLSSAAKVLKGAAGTATGITSTILNKLIDVTPFEIPIAPGYQYCGPGTKLEKRLARGDPGINKLDQACKAHDIAYSLNSDNSNRAKADRILANAAWEIFKNPKTPLAERGLSYLVTNVMKAKNYFGGSLRKKKKKKNERRSYSNDIRRKAIAQLKQHIAGKGYYLKPYPPLSGGRLLIPPPPPPSSSYGVSLFPQVKKRRTTKKSRKMSKKSKKKP